MTILEDQLLAAAVSAGRVPVDKQLRHQQWQQQLASRLEIQEAILNNEPLDDTLHVIAVVSNPCMYYRRYQLAREFFQRMEHTPHVTLYIVELVYGNQTFAVTESGHPRHLQLRTMTSPIWHKESMIRCGVQSLLPPSWRAMAWIDADLEFEQPTWAIDTLRILNGTKDIVQLFSHALSLNADHSPNEVYTGFGYQYVNHTTFRYARGLEYWHPGFAWACTKTAYEQMDGLLEYNILGSGDYIMARAWIGQVEYAISAQSSPEHKRVIMAFQERCTQAELRLGYVPGMIQHYYHGSKANRRYSERNQILLQNHYNPDLHVTHDPDTGLLITTPLCPRNMLVQIMAYFSERNEDECLEEDPSLLLPLDLPSI